MTLRTATKTLLVLALALPIIQSVLFWIAGMLVSMGDEPGAAIIRHVSTGCQVVWSVSLVGLVIAVAMLVLNERRPDDD
jgi:hypothetical protein